MVNTTENFENKIWFLSTCDTCKKIMKELDISDNFEMYNLKDNPISIEDLTEIKNGSGLSYEDLFNKRAQKYKSIKDEIKSEKDFENAILSEYTFLKRPIIRIDGEYFVGNSKKVVELAKEKLN